MSEFEKIAEDSEQKKDSNEKLDKPKKSSKDDKNGFFARTKTFFKDFVAEFKRVVWPTKKELFVQTKDVIAVSLLVAGIILVYDFIFSKGISLLMGFTK